MRLGSLLGGIRIGEVMPSENLMICSNLGISYQIYILKELVIVKNARKILGFALVAVSLFAIVPNSASATVH